MPKPLREGFTPYSFRLGTEVIPKFGGMRREGPRYAIPPHQFYDLQNVRLVGGELVARGGQSKLNSGAALSGCIYGMGQVEPDEGGGKTGAGMGAFGLMIGGRTILDIYNPELSPTVQVLLTGLAATTSEFVHSGKLWALDSGHQISLSPDGLGGIVGEKRQVFATPSGNLPSASGIEGGSSGTAHAAVVAPTVDADRVGERDLWFITDSDILYYWTGKQVVEDATGLTGAKLLFHYNEDLYVAANNSLKKRDDGDWTAITFPTTGMYSGGTFRPLCYRQYSGDLYIGGIDVESGGSIYYGRILKYDGSTLAHVNDTHLGNSETDDPVIAGMEVFDSKLYYLNYDPAGQKLYVGQFNGTTWTDTHKDFTGQVSGVEKGYSPRLFRGDLYIIDGTNKDLYRSPGTSVDGTWVKVNSSSFSAVVRQLTVY